MQLVEIIEEVEANADRFSQVHLFPDNPAYKNLSRYFHWYYFPATDSFAPSKFLGYKNTDPLKYVGAGTGTDTTRRLAKWFTKINPKSELHIELLVRLKTRLTLLGHKLNDKADHGTGGIYIQRGATVPALFPEEIVEAEFFEGALKKVFVNKYERDPKARAACIRKHGYGCAACGLDFEQRYGQLGAKFIHVHHITPISNIKKGYKVNPETDLRPLCPNCHAMVHRENPPIDIEVLARQIRDA